MKTLSAEARRARQIIAKLAHVESVDDESLEELRSLGDDALQSLSVACDSPSLPTRRVAAIALARMGSRKTLAALLNAVAKLEGEDDVIAEALERAADVLEPRDYERVAPFLKRTQKGASPAVEAAIARCFSAIEGDAPTNAEEDGRIRLDVDLRMGGAPTGIAEATATVPRAASMDLISNLGSRSEKERREARSALLRHPDRDRVVTEHLHHPDVYVRRSVLEVAAVAGISSLRRALLDISIEASRPENERALALRGITVIAEESFERQAIEANFADRDIYVRAEALRLGASSNEEPLVRTALATLTHDEPWVRKRVAEGWAGIANGQRQGDLPQIFQALLTGTWTHEPSSLDIEAFQALAGGITRLVELGGEVDSTMLGQLRLLIQSPSREISALAEQLSETLQTMAAGRS